MKMSFSKISRGQMVESLLSIDSWIEDNTVYGSREITYQHARQPLAKLIPVFIFVLKVYKQKVLQGYYYWATKNPYYLKLVKSTEFPDTLSQDELLEYAYNVKDQVSGT
jgi:hypothetical protein